MRIVLSIVVIALTAGGLSMITLAAAEAWGRGRAAALIVGIWIVVQLVRLGYDHDDGIDIRQLLFPAPFDWPVKIERTIHFWTSPRMWFRAVYLGCSLALVIVSIALAARN